MSHRKSGKKTRKNKTPKKRTSLFRKVGFGFIKWGFIAFIWCFLVGGLYTAWIAYDLPERLNSPKFDTNPSVTIRSKDGVTIARYGSLQSEPEQIGSLPSSLINAILSIEDRNFYTHPGVDISAIARAMVINLQHGSIVQGGSTITQQLAKNLFLTHDRTINRKIRELLAALWLEKNFTKDEILQAYTNNVYMGSGIYGMPAASQYYFNKDLQDLTLRESATLAGMLKAPSKYAPTVNEKLSEQRTDIVLQAMAETGYITVSDLKTPSKKGRFAHDNIASVSQNNGLTNKGYFTDAAVKRAKDRISSQSLSFIVDSTFDPKAQRIVESILLKTMTSIEDDYDAIQAAAVVMRKDGAVLALVGGRDYTKSQFNRATQARRQPGSAFKTLLYLTALRQGWSSSDKIFDGPIKDTNYQPKNFDHNYHGQVTLSKALSLSLNTASVRLMREVGPANVIQTARQAGIKSKLSKDLSLALGTSGLSLLELTGAYAVIANGGFESSPYFVEKISTPSGQVIYERMTEKPGKRFFDDMIVKDMDIMLKDVVKSGTGKKAKLPFPAAGKTGTSQDHRDAWFIGYSGDIIIGIWLGRDDNTPMISKHKNRAVTGGGLPALIWRNIVLGLSEQGLIQEKKGEDLGGLIDRLLSISPASSPKPLEARTRYDFNN